MQGTGVLGTGMQGTGVQGTGMQGTGTGMGLWRFSGARLSCLGAGGEGVWWGTGQEDDIKMFSLKLLTHRQAYGLLAEQRFAFANQ